MEPVEDKTLDTADQGVPQVNNNSKVKSILGISFAIIGAILVYYILSSITVEQGSESDIRVLSEPGRMLAAFFIVALVLWSTEAIPIGITALLIVVLTPLLNIVNSISEAAVGFTTPVVYFVIGVYCLAFAVILHLPLPIAPTINAVLIRAARSFYSVLRFFAPAGRGTACDLF